MKMYEKHEQMTLPEFVDWATNKALCDFVDSGGRGFKQAIYDIITSALMREKHDGWKKK